MLSWKEKVAEKLSSLLGDAPSSPSHADLDSPLAPHQAMSLSSGQLSSPKKSRFASFLSYFPTRNSVDNGRVSNSPTHMHGARPPVRVRSLPPRWKANSFKWKDAPLDENADSVTGSETDEVVEISKGDVDDVSERNISGDNPGGTEKASTLNILEDSLSCLTEKSTFINVNLYEFFESSLPNIVKGCRWVLLYSTLKHGISLRTLLRRSVSLPGPCLLIVGDMKGAVFGGLLDSPLKPTAKRKYQGTNNTFVFTTIYGEPRLFRATGANRYYYLCVNDALAFGGGGNFALCLDEDLLHGTSGPCETFGNLCLAHSSEFELKNVELWGFSHSFHSLA